MAERKDESTDRDKARRDTITADDLKGVAAVPQDGDGESEANTSGANAGDRQTVEADPGTG